MKFLHTSAGLAGSLAALANVAAAAAAAAVIDAASFAACDIIDRDVAIVGGGSAGTYSAVRLRDHGLSTVIVEAKPRLGGNAESYTDPATGETFNIGVVVFGKTPTVRNYFARFGVPLVDLSASGGNTSYVDFSSGRTLAGYTPPSEQAFGAALQRYAAQLQKYPALQQSFNLTYPVEPDLLLPFGDFVAKYQLADLFPTIFAVNQGYAPILEISTIYMLKYLNAGQLASFANGFLTTASDNTPELYDRVAASMGADDVLYNSTVEQMDRDRSPVQVVVRTPAGRKLIRARKVLSAIPPTPATMRGFDLSRRERSLFSQFYANGYFTGVIKDAGLPAGGPGLQNADAAARYGVPQLPGPYTYGAAQGTNLTHVYYGSPTPLSYERASEDILANLERYKKANGIATGGKAARPQLVKLSGHQPFNLMVPAGAIRAGFYEKLFALQGARNTYYNGAAWQAQDSSVLWEFTDNYVVPLMLRGLGK